MSLFRFACCLAAVAALASSCGGREISSLPVDGTGGVPGSGGASGGVANSGGSGGTGGSPRACVANFVTPARDAILTHADDANGDRCGDGFQYDVEVATDAPNGTTAVLFSGAAQVGRATVLGGKVRFEDVQLTSQGEVELLVAIDAGAGCEGKVEFEVDCGVPTCDIVAPVVAPSKPVLNGVPVADGGDRVSSPGAPYQVAFEVETNVADGQPVMLKIDGEAAGLSVLAENGKASFPAVVLEPDGEHTVSAACFGEEGVVGRSAEGIYTVDTEPPALTVHKDLGGALSALANGDHFGPDDDADPQRDGLQMRICGLSASEDALDLAEHLAAGPDNLCAKIGTSAADCAPARANGTPGGAGACIDVDCPGAGVFSLSVTLRDGAGNPTTRTLNNLTCASSNPSVQFLDPVDGDTILAADNTAATKKDKDGDEPGAQYDVIACTTAAQGTARLLGGPSGVAPMEIATGTIVPALQADQCPPGMVGKVVFANVRLPESPQNSAFEFTDSTRLRVEVTDTSTASGATAIDLKVDSTPPALALQLPPGLCGSFIESDVGVTRDLRFATAIAPVAVTIDGGSCGPTCAPSSEVSFGTALVSQVAFALGTNQLAATVTEPSGNVGRLSSPCEVTVGPVPPPSVAWKTPVSTSRLTASTTTGAVALPDEDAGVAGWQGTLKACTNIDLDANPGATVQFSVVGGGPIGAPVALVAEGSGSCAELAGATVPEGMPVQLRATTSEIDGAVGVATISVPVDVTPPSAIASLSPSVLDRRQTSFRLAWTAPADGAGSVSGYQVRVSATKITDATFDTATPVPYTSTPSVAGSPDSVDVSSRLIETDYYFAIAAVDLVGNRGPIRATASPLRAKFETVLLPAAAGTGGNLGSPLDGSTDLDGDGFGDIIAGNLLSSNLVHVYFGSASGPSATGRTTTITGSFVGFGASVGAVDLDGDGRPELVIGSHNENTVYVFAGRTSWPAALTSAEASARIVLDPALETAAVNAAFGVSLARLGDFDGDGVEDLAIGAPFYDGGRGLVAVVRGRDGGFGPTVTLPTEFGTGAQRIEGNPGVVGNFGWMVAGAGTFFSGDRGDLLVGAPFQSAGGTNQGAIVAFRGRAVSPVTLFAEEADATLYGANNDRLGREKVALLGRIGPQGQPAFGLPIYGAGSKGQVWLTSGSSEAGPFATFLGELHTTAATPGRLIGRTMIGGGFSGTSTGISFIRSSAPDVVIPSLDGPKLFFLSNETLQALPSGLQAVESHADLVYELPSEALPWTDFGRSVTAARDLNGDGYGDLLLGDVDYTAAADGKILVLY